MIVQIQGEDKNLYQVDLSSRQCSCGRDTCGHLIIASDIYLNRGKRFRFDIVSSAHKSARTSNIRETWPWIQTYMQISGGIDRVATYFRKIIFEETRAIALWEKFKRRELTPIQEVRSLILARKKWESVPGLQHHMDWWINSFKAYQREKQSWNEPRLRQVLRSFQDIESGYAALFFVKENSKLKPVFWEEITARAEREKNERLKRFLKFEPTSGYERMISTEITLQIFDEQANEMHPDCSTTEIFIPAFQDKFSDVHCWAGRRRFLRWYPELVKGQLPPESGLSLELSGQIFGVAHRFAAFNKYGSMTTKNGELIPWQNVRLEQSLDDIAWLDSWYYTRVYASLAKKGLWKDPMASREATSLASNEDGSNPQANLFSNASTRLIPSSE